MKSINEKAIKFGFNNTYGDKAVTAGKNGFDRLEPLINHFGAKSLKEQELQYKNMSCTEIVKMLCDPEGENELFQRDYEDYKQYEELKKKIMASETKEDFVKNVKKFVEEFKDGTFLPMTNRKGEDKVALWTNWGVEGLIGDDENAKGYEGYMDDEHCVLFKELWGITKEFTKEQKTPFARELVEQGKTQYSSTPHVPYDMILSEIYAEYIGKEKLKDVRIEYGQNKKDTPYGKEIVRTQNVLFQSELPVYLARSAKLNIGLKVLEENKVNIEKALARRVEKSEDVEAPPPGREPSVVPLEHKDQKLTVDFKKDLLKPMEGVTFQLEHNEKLKGVRDELIKKEGTKPDGKEKEKSGDGKMGKSTKEYTDEELNKSKRDFEERKKDRKAMTFPKPDRAIDIDELRSSELHSGIMVDILKGRAKDSTGGKPEGGKIRDAELTIEEARNAIGASLKAALAGVRASSPPTGGLNQPGAPNTPILREKTKKTAGDGIGGGV